MCDYRRLFLIVLWGFIALSIVAVWNRHVLRKQLHEASRPILVRPQGCGQSAALARPWSVYPNPIPRRRVHRV
jgi:hypothetical protein